MKVAQIASILNQMIGETTGETGILTDDLTFVDGGITLSDYGETLMANGVDNFVKSLMDRIGKTIFVDRSYNSSAPNILRDSFEYGSIIEKIRCEVDDFVDDDSWKLVKGKSYDPFKFNPPTTSVKLFNGKSAVRLDISFAERQVKSAFGSPYELNKFFSKIENRIILKHQLALEDLTMAVINNLMAKKIKSGKNVVRLLTDYNTLAGTSLTAEKAMIDKDFIKYANMQISLYREYLKKASVLYNESGYLTFTPKDKQKLILLSKFVETSKFYLESDTYHNNLVGIDNYETMPYWQGSSTDINKPLSEISKIDVKLGDNEEDTVSQSYILGMLCDIDSMAIYNEFKDITAQPNAIARFTNYFYFSEMSFFNDVDENAVVFTLT